MTEIAETDPFDSIFKVYAYKMETLHQRNRSVRFFQTELHLAGRAVSYRGSIKRMVDTGRNEYSPAQVVASVYEHSYRCIVNLRLRSW